MPTETLGTHAATCDRVVLVKFCSEFFQYFWTCTLGKPLGISIWLLWISVTTPPPPTPSPSPLGYVEYRGGTSQICLKKMFRVFQKRLMDIFECFKNASRKFVLQFCCCMIVIVVTQATGLLVCFWNWFPDFTICQTKESIPKKIRNFGHMSKLLVGRVFLSHTFSQKKVWTKIF